MSRTTLFADWVDLLVIELTFIELYKSATPSQKEEMKATLHRLAAGINQADLAAFVSQAPNLESALDSFTPEERARLVPQLSDSVTELAQHVTGLLADRD